MPRETYQLINPVIEGTFNDVVDSSKTPIKAAEEIWGRITEHVSGHVPKFMFSLRNVKDHSLSHFEVKEKLSNGSYTIKEIEGLDVDSDAVDTFHSHIDSVRKEQEGGARKRYKKYNKDGRSRYPKDSSSSSDSDSDSDIYSGIEFNARTTSPIAMFHYTTKFYQQRDGLIFEHKSTANPEVTLVPTVPVVPVVPVGTIVSTRHSFSSIPVFKSPLLPCINIWH